MKPIILLACSLTCFGGCSKRIAKTENPNDGKSQSIERPAKFVGTWLWWWSDGPAYHLVLHQDGKAEKLSGFDPVLTGGNWKIDKSGFLDVRFTNPEVTMRFRIDSDTEIMDVETISTDRDFPWEKVDKVFATLADTIPNAK